MLSGTLVDCLAVGLFGGAIGMSELVARYRDAPGAALRTKPALLYIALNIGAALLALGLIRIFAWDFGVDSSNAAAVRWTQVTVAGFGAMALFRSSLFTIRAGGVDIGVGPSSFLLIVLSAADRAVDRLRAEARAITVTTVMAGVSFAKSREALPALCLALMQNLPREDQDALAKSIGALASSSMDEVTKSLALGLAVINVVGEGVLNAALKSLGTRVKSVSKVSVMPDTLSIKAGTFSQLQATVADVGNTTILGAVPQWTTSDLLIADVGPSGRVGGKAAGTAVVTASVEGVIGNCTVTVTI